MRCRNVKFFLRGPLVLRFVITVTLAHPPKGLRTGRDQIHLSLFDYSRVMLANSSSHPVRCCIYGSEYLG